jgi:competence protein ComEC
MAKLKIAFLDVGHGDFIYAKTPLGDNLIIDLGTGDVVPSQYLEKITSISELQISHPHTDHFDDIIGISKKTIKSFRCTNLDAFTDKVIGWKKSDKDKISMLRQLKKTLNADNSAVKSGNNFSHTVWFPENVDPNNPNTASVITTLSYKGVKILFGGDLPNSGWLNLLENSNFVKAISGTTIFKVPHHGRKEGCCEDLFKLSNFKPMLCVISDKAIEKDNRNTIATNWYCKRTSGCNVVGYSDKKYVLSTRNDGSIYIEVEENGSCTIYPNTRWKK